MSTANLQRFLEYLVDDLEGTSKNFRTQISNVKEHSITISAQRLVTQTFKELKAREINLSENGAQATAIRTAANETFNKLRESVGKSLIRHEKRYNLNRHPQTQLNSKNSLTAVYQIAETEAGNAVDIFSKVKNSYKKAINEYYTELREILGGGTIPVERGNFFQGGHAQTQGVLETRATEAAALAFFDVGDIAIDEFVTKSRTQVAATLRALMSKEVDKLSIIIESADANAKDGKKVQIKKAHFLAAAYKAIDRITNGQGITGFAGSDTPLTAKRKQTIKAATDPFKKIKGVKVTTEDIKIKSSKGVAVKTVKKKITPGRTPALRDPVTGRFIGKKQHAQNQFNLFALLKAKLPETVAKNMGLPRLVWRTGRFSSSVEPINIRTTPREGIPIVEYRYQMDPYQVFEQGLGRLPWNTPEREPRDLIDVSIREIAATIAVTRLQTRRV